MAKYAQLTATGLPHGVLLTIKDSTGKQVSNLYPEANANAPDNRPRFADGTGAIDPAAYVPNGTYTVAYSGGSQTVVVSGASGTPADSMFIDLATQAELDAAGTAASGTYESLGGVVDRLHVFGHSYAEGYLTSGMPSAPFNRYSSLLARRLGALEVNHAVSGAGAQLSQRNLCGRVNNRVQPSNAPATVGPVKLAIVDIGANDAGDATMYTLPALFPALVTNAVRRLRACQVWEDTDAVWSFTQNGGASNWGTSATGNYKSGATSTVAGGAKILGAAGNQFTFTTPSTFQGGTVYLVGFHAGPGSVFSMTVDGSAAAAWDTTPVSSGAQVYPDAYPLTLSAGVHTVVGTCTTFGAGTWVDYAMRESDTPPGVILPQVMAAPTQPSGAGTHSPITAADLATFNGYLQSVATSFADGMVKYHPRSLDVSNAALWASDGAHPSDLGHELLDGQLWAFLLGLNWLGSKLPRAKAAGRSAFPRLHIAGHLDDSAADRVTLVAGTATLSSRAITGSTRAVLTRVGTNANAGHLSYAVVTATTTSTPGTMTIASSNVADTSVIDVLLYEAVNTS